MQSPDGCKWFGKNSIPWLRDFASGHRGKFTQLWNQTFAKPYTAKSSLLEVHLASLKYSIIGKLSDLHATNSVSIHIHNGPQDHNA